VVATDPRVSQRRRRWERVIWVLDMAAYGFLAFSGWAALFAPSAYIVQEVTDGRVILVWGSLLFAGGVFGLLGRLVRLWAVEILANVAAWSGAVIYAYIVGAAVATGSSMILFGFVVAAVIATFRRYAELQIFTSEPGLDTFTKRVASLLRRRTDYAVHRKHY